TWGPVETVVLLIPNLSQARTSLKRINELEDKINISTPIEEVMLTVKPFHILDLKHVSFAYKPAADATEGSTFSIGPINFSVNRGDVIFISGGNGSGKTTFVNILISLLSGNEGDIYVNDNLVLPVHAKSYK